MANRLSVIATRTGDDGTTGLGTVPAALGCAAHRGVGRRG